jgi:antitoxin component YwqK of YwqJK toxin-antitoxin module
MNNLKATTYLNGKFKSQAMCNDDKTDGFRVQWYESGQMKSAGEYKHNKPDGLYTFWYENGSRSAEINYSKGIKDGHLILWHKDGSKKSEVIYSNGKMNSLWVSWYVNGRIQKAVLFKDQKKVSKTYWYNNGRLKLQANYESSRRYPHILPELSYDFSNPRYVAKNELEYGEKKPYHVSLLSEKIWFKNGIVKDKWANNGDFQVNIGWYKNGQKKYDYGGVLSTSRSIDWHENGQVSRKFEAGAGAADVCIGFDVNGIKEYENKFLPYVDFDSLMHSICKFYKSGDKKTCTIETKVELSFEYTYWCFYDNHNNIVYEYMHRDNNFLALLDEDKLWDYWMNLKYDKLTAILTDIEKHKSLLFRPFI